MPTRSYEYRIYPTKTQVEQLTAMLGDFCFLYNAALEERISAYRHGVSLNFPACKSQIPIHAAISSLSSPW